MDTQDSAGTSGARRVRTALAGAVLAVGLLAPVPAAAQPVPAQPTPRATATTTATTATGTTAQQASTTPQQAGTTAESTVTNGSLSRKKTIAALVLGFVVALAAAVLVYRRSARDNRLG